ncbi:MAG: hypothetical protein AB1Z23_10055 [Eubacteriales bacterium]
MPEQLAKWIEVIFDISYLITVWTITALMFKNRSKLSPENKSLGMLFILAFFFLAIGDTGHVGFRVPALLMGGIDANAKLVGIGSLATAIMITFFYMIIAEIWRVRFDKKRNFLWWFLMAVGVVRLVIMAFPQNNWLKHTVTLGWNLARNIPLMVQGLVVAVALLVCGIRQKDKFPKSISVMIFISYAFYFPVVFFSRQIPILGMLMIPKTLAYVAVAVIAYIVLFKREAVEK